MPARVQSERTSLSNCADAASTPSISLRWRCRRRDERARGGEVVGRSDRVSEARSENLRDGRSGDRDPQGDGRGGFR
jgi:hypothetical protein